MDWRGSSYAEMVKLLLHAVHLVLWQGILSVSLIPTLVTRRASILYSKGSKIHFPFGIVNIVCHEGTLYFLP